jgi:hypothetical protein
MIMVDVLAISWTPVSKSMVALIYDARRPFLLPRVRALLRMAFILLSLVGDVGLEVESLPDRSVW